MKSSPKIQKLPNHIAFIMDGNGRWAKQHMLSRNMGHKQGIKTLQNILDVVYNLGVKYVSVYAFSTENTRRPDEEVEGLKRLMEDNIGRLATDHIRKGIRLTVMGDMSYFSRDLQQKVESLCRDSQGGKNGVLNIGLNYGARAEIVKAVNDAVKSGKQVTEESLSSLLYTSGMPDPDLIIRTGGEVRLSNFMLYQSAYSELYFSDVLWPDFDEKELKKILDNYATRNRRYGAV